MNINKVQTLLERIFDDCREGLREELSCEEYQRRKDDFVFHMTDWLEDLDELQQLFANPDGQSIDQATSTIIGFLAHVGPHLTTAGDLLLDHVPNCFADAATSAMDK